MKKFLIFLVSIIVVVSLGLTTYYFLRNDEVIAVKTNEIFCNAGDIITLDDLQISRKKPHQNTTFDYNAGGEDVTKYIAFDEASNCYVVSNTAGGTIKLVIATNNDKFPIFEISVHVGNGTVENPYYIFGENELNKIGGAYALDANYRLMNNITLTSVFEPIGFNKSNSAWDGFSGDFDGNNYTISGLNLTKDYECAGLFSSINDCAKVYDLKIKDSNIQGASDFVGALAGKIYGSVNRVAVENVIIDNAKTSATVGAFAGLYNGNSLKISYVEKATINVADNSTVGGFIGKVLTAFIQATYANDVEIGSQGALNAVGGFAGEFAISTTNGSIQQSYANTSSSASNYGAFIGKITEVGAGFDNPTSMLRHLIGNIAITNNALTIDDRVLVNSFNNTYFVLVNNVYVNRNVFYNTEASLYMIRGFVDVATATNTVDAYIFYGLDANNLEYWDTDYVWSTSNSRMPELVMGSVEPGMPTSDYFNRNLAHTNANNQTFNNIMSNDIIDQNIEFAAQGEFELTNHTPIKLINSVIDGKGSVIRVNLANSADNALGLFSMIEKSTVKNLKIVVIGMSANADFAGALAGSIGSNDPLVYSSIDNVEIVFDTTITSAELDTFGGLAGSISKTNVDNVTVSGLNLTGNTNSIVAGGLSGKIADATVNNVDVTASIYGREKVAGLVAINHGNIVNSKVNASLTVSYTAAISVGGVSANNYGAIYNNNATVNIVIDSAVNDVFAGGIAANNHGTISKTNVSGAGISVARELNANIYIGGLVSFNTNNITDSFNTMDNIGTYHIGKNYHVAGIAHYNSGNIERVVAGSNIYGNIVSGVVNYMVDTNDDRIDQVLVAKYVPGAINENHIYGDKYVAGVAYNLSKGIISNIQTVSKLEGATNNTVSSLIVIIFPQGASLDKATINNSIEGAGSKYRESWMDYDKVINGINDSHKFNIYDSEASAGIMKNVVINTYNKTGVEGTKAAQGDISMPLVFIPGPGSYNGNSYVRYVSNQDFYNSAMFTGSFTFNHSYCKLYDYYRTETKVLEFDLNTIWVAGSNGISLAFVL